MRYELKNSITLKVKVKVKVKWENRLAEDESEAVYELKEEGEKASQSLSK